jgi:hypothetical protein
MLVMFAEEMEDMIGIFKADFFDQVSCGFLFQCVSVLFKVAAKKF